MQQSGSKVIIRNYKEGDEVGIIKLLALNWRHLTDKNALKYWSWEYKECPREAIVKVAEHDGKIVGHYALLPLTMRHKMETLIGAKAEGGIIHPNYRGKAGIKFLPSKEQGTIYHLLITGALEEANEKGIKLVWGFPNKIAIKGQVKAGYTHMVIPVSSFILPVNISRTMKYILSQFSITEDKKEAVSLLPKSLRKWLTTVSLPDLEALHIENVKINEGLNGSENFWDNYKEQNSSITIERTKEYLQWRSIDNPVLEQKIFTASNPEGVNAIVAVAIVRKGKIVEGRIVDMLCLKGHEKDMRLLSAYAVRFLRNQGVDFITTWMINNQSSNVYQQLLKQVNFLELPLQLMDVLVRGFDLPNHYITDPENWYVTMTFTEGVA